MGRLWRDGRGIFDRDQTLGRRIEKDQLDLAFQHAQQAPGAVLGCVFVAQGIRQALFIEYRGHAIGSARLGSAGHQTRARLKMMKALVKNASKIGTVRISA